MILIKLWVIVVFISFLTWEKDEWNHLKVYKLVVGVTIWFFKSPFCILILRRLDTLHSNMFHIWLPYILTLPMLRLLSSKAQGCSLLKTIQTLSCWYSLDSSRWVLSDECPCARVSVIFQCFFASFCVGQISYQQHWG